MRCKDVQTYLAVDAQTSQLPAEVWAHLLKCPECRQAQAIFAEIDLQLREQPAWLPPPGFAERVSVMGIGALSARPPKPRGFLQDIVLPALATARVPVLLGVLAAIFCLVVLQNGKAMIAGYPELIAAMSRAQLANAIQLAWVTGILSLGFSAWITLRALRWD